MNPFLKKFFPEVYRKKQMGDSANQYCKYDNQLLQTFTSSLSSHQHTYVYQTFVSLFRAYIHLVAVL